MKMAYLRFDTLGVLLCVGASAAASAGCFIAGDDDDGNASAETGGPGSATTPVTMSGDNSMSTTNGEGSGTTPGTGDDTTDSGMLPDGCGDNLLQDPGFEGGTPSDVWAEASDVFGTPICNAGCSEEAGAEPYAGDWWAWFGGIEQMDNSSVSQSIAIDPEAAILRFRLWINTGGGTGMDEFYVDIDGMNVFMVTDLDEAEYDSYTLVEVPVDEFADGMMHTVTFGAEISGESLTNFFLDDVLLVSCSEGGGSSTTMGTMTATDTDASTTMGDTDTGEPTSTGTGTGDGTAGTAAS
jgi:hypothetical protein